MEVHPVVRAALAGERPDLRLTAVIVELDPEGGLELPAERRRQGLGGREADAVVEVAARVESHLARGVAEVGEEARRPGVDRRSPRARHLHLEPARTGPTVDDEAARLLERTVEPEPSGHDVIRERHVRHVAATHAHRGDRVDEHRRPATFLGEPRDVDRPGRGMERCEFLARRGEELAERGLRPLIRDQVRLERQRHPPAEVVIVPQHLGTKPGRCVGLAQERLQLDAAFRAGLRMEHSRGDELRSREQIGRQPIGGHRTQCYQ